MRSHSITPRLLLQRFAPPALTLGPVSQSSQSARSGRWLDVVGIIGAEALAWAERLVSFGNHRLVQVPMPVSGGAPICERRTRAARRRSSQKPRQAALEARGMHLASNPGFSYSGIGSRSLRQLAAYAVALQARPLDSPVYLAALAHTERRRPVA